MILVYVALPGKSFQGEAFSGSPCKSGDAGDCGVVPAYPTYQKFELVAANSSHRLRFPPKKRLTTQLFSVGRAKFKPSFGICSKKYFYSEAMDKIFE